MKKLYLCSKIICQLMFFFFRNSTGQLWEHRRGYRYMYRNKISLMLMQILYKRNFLWYNISNIREVKLVVIEYERYITQDIFGRYQPKSFHLFCFHQIIMTYYFQNWGFFFVNLHKKYFNKHYNLLLFWI